MSWTKAEVKRAKEALQSALLVAGGIALDGSGHVSATPKPGMEAEIAARYLEYLASRHEGWAEEADRVVAQARSPKSVWGEFSEEMALRFIANGKENRKQAGKYRSFAEKLRALGFPSEAR